jgi:hypothetical protein
MGYSLSNCLRYGLLEVTRKPKIIRKEFKGSSVALIQYILMSFTERRLLSVLKCLFNFSSFGIWEG